LGLAFQDLGMTTVVEPQSRVLVEQSLIETPRTYEEALRAERLYRLQTNRTRLVRAQHAVQVATELLTGFPSPRMVSRLWGRIKAHRETDPRPRYEARLERARAELQRADTASSVVHGAFVSSSRGQECSNRSPGRRAA
jgi:hypothetical protein